MRKGRGKKPQYVCHFDDGSFYFLNTIVAPTLIVGQSSIIGNVTSAPKIGVRIVSQNSNGTVTVGELITLAGHIVTMRDII